MYKTKSLTQRLLQSETVSIQVDDPLHSSSGLLVPMYVDLRLLLADFENRRELVRALVELAESFRKVEVIAATSPTGIPWGMLLAQEMKIAFVYVRLRRKSHGPKTKIEGVLPAGQRTLVIDDVGTTGSSIISTARAVESVGAVVLGAISIFSFGLQIGIKKFTQAGLEHRALINLEDILEVGIERGYFSAATASALREWAEAPALWRPPDQQPGNQP